MRFIDYVKIAFRNMVRRKLRTILTIVAVMIGTVAVITLLSLAVSARDFLLGQLESLGMLTRVQVVSDPDADTDIMGGGGYMDPNKEVVGVKLTDAVMEDIQKLDHVTYVMPSIRTSIGKEGAIDGHGKIDFFDVMNYRLDSPNPPMLSAGRLFSSDDERNVVVVGYAYLKKLGFKDQPEAIVGKVIHFKTHEGWFGLDSTLPSTDAPEEAWRKEQTIDATVIGVTHPGPDEYTSYVSEGWVRYLMKTKRYDWPDKAEQEALQEQLKVQEEDARRRGEEFDRQAYEIKPAIVIDDPIEKNGYPAILATVDEFTNVEGVATEIRTMGMGAATAKEFLATLEQAFLVIEIVLGAIGSIALLVAAIGIINTMVMSILERTREIGVMKAVGASRRTIRLLFTFEAALIGFWGGVFGTAVGWGLITAANMVAKNVLAGQNFALDQVVTLPWWLAASVVGFSMIVGLLSGLYPAAKAARLDPIEALHQE